MKLRPFFIILSVLLLTALVTAQTPQTMCLDYYHTGDTASELFSLDRVVLEPLPWPGNPRPNLDETNLGKYFFEVRDKATGKPLYSRGFVSVFGEWETTDETEEAKRTFSESLRFPAPFAPVRIVLSKRDEHNGWRELWQTELDANDMTVDRAAPPSAGPLITVEMQWVGRAAMLDLRRVPQGPFSTTSTMIC